MNLGCFLSQYSLWRKSLDEHKTICIFEHDVLFKKRFSIEKNFEDVIKSKGFLQKPMNVGQWWEVQESIVLNPGAKKIVSWISKKWSNARRLVFEQWNL